NNDMERVLHIILSLGQSTKVELSPGEYLLRARLPSGELVRKSISITADNLEIGIMGKRSPHEWLARHHFFGHLPASPVLLSPNFESTTWLRLWSRKGLVEWQPEKWPGEPPTGDGQGVVGFLRLSTEKI